MWLVLRLIIREDGSDRECENAQLERLTGDCRVDCRLDCEDYLVIVVEARLLWNDVSSKAESQGSAGSYALILTYVDGKSLI